MAPGDTPSKPENTPKAPEVKLTPRQRMDKYYKELAALQGRGEQVITQNKKDIKNLEGQLQKLEDMRPAPDRYEEWEINVAKLEGSIAKEKNDLVEYQLSHHEQEVVLLIELRSAAIDLMNQYADKINKIAKDIPEKERAGHPKLAPWVKAYETVQEKRLNYTENRMAVLRKEYEAANEAYTTELQEKRREDLLRRIDVHKLANEEMTELKDTDPRKPRITEIRNVLQNMLEDRSLLSPEERSKLEKVNLYDVRSLYHRPGDSPSDHVRGVEARHEFVVESSLTIAHAFDRSVRSLGVLAKSTAGSNDVQSIEQLSKSIETLTTKLQTVKQYQHFSERVTQSLIDSYTTTNETATKEIAAKEAEIKAIETELKPLREKLDPTKPDSALRKKIEELEGKQKKIIEAVKILKAAKSKREDILLSLRGHPKDAEIDESEVKKDPGMLQRWKDQIADVKTVISVLGQRKEKLKQEKEKEKKEEPKK